MGWANEPSWEWAEDSEHQFFDEEQTMDMTKYSGTESQWLKAQDMLGANLKVTIQSVEILKFDAEGEKPATERAALKFVGKEKGLVLNATNNKTLCKAYGDDSDAWIGHVIGLKTEEYDNFPAGWIVKPLDIKEADFDDDIPF